MTKLTYRGCNYFKEEEAKAQQAWWNLAHRPWLGLTYRGHHYMPYVTGGQIK